MVLRITIYTIFLSVEEENGTQDKYHLLIWITKQKYTWPSNNFEKQGKQTHGTSMFMKMIKQLKFFTQSLELDKIITNRKHQP